MTYEQQKYFLGVPIPRTRRVLEPRSVIELATRGETDQFGKKRRHVTAVLHVSADGSRAAVLKESDGGLFTTTITDQYTTENPEKFNKANVRNEGFLIYTRYRDK